MRPGRFSTWSFFNLFTHSTSLIDDTTHLHLHLPPPQHEKTSTFFYLSNYGVQRHGMTWKAIGVGMIPQCTCITGVYLIDPTFLLQRPRTTNFFTTNEFSLVLLPCLVLPYLFTNDEQVFTMPHQDRDKDISSTLYMHRLRLFTHETNRPRGLSYGEGRKGKIAMTR